jgi:hypothetical protein
MSLASEISDSNYAYQIRNGGYPNAEIYSAHDISDEDIWAIAHILGDSYTGSGAIAVYRRPGSAEVTEPT